MLKPNVPLYSILMSGLPSRFLLMLVDESSDPESESRCFFRYKKMAMAMMMMRMTPTSTAARM